MKGQSRIDFRSRKHATIVNTDIPKNKKIVDESEHVERAFRPVAEVPFESIKVQKKAPPPPRKSGRLATKNLTQTVLILKNDTDTTEKETVCKRKLDQSKKLTNKKQKTIHDTASIEKDSQPLNEAPNEKGIKENDEAIIINEKDATIDKVKVIVEQSETVVETQDVSIDQINIASDESEIVQEKEAAVKEHVDTTEEQKDISKEFEHVVENQILIQETLSFEEKQVEPPSSQPEDSPSPPSALSLLEPATPPTHSVAPFKEYVTPSDKQRITYEKTTLQKLRKALDIVITDRAARNRPTLYHQIEPVLRNSTQRTITLSHICKVMYLAPSLYTLKAKELRNYGGKVTEAFLIEFGKDWVIPLNGKELQKRSDLLTEAIEHYFEAHCQPDASVPEIPLPRLALVVDKKEWIKDAKLPPGVRSLLQAHEKAKQADEEEEKPKPKPTGTVKDRMAALRARLAEKKASSSSS